jgi:hypothetical protein
MAEYKTVAIDEEAFNWLEVVCKASGLSKGTQTKALIKSAFDALARDLLGDLSEVGNDSGLMVQAEAALAGREFMSAATMAVLLKVNYPTASWLVDGLKERGRISAEYDGMACGYPVLKVEEEQTVSQAS